MYTYTYTDDPSLSLYIYIHIHKYTYIPGLGPKRETSRCEGRPGRGTAAEARARRRTAIFHTKNSQTKNL